MATTTEPPRPDTLTTSILDRLPDDLVARLAALEPEAVAALAEAMRRESRRRANLELTRQTIEAARAGKDVTRHADAEAMFAHLGI